MYRGNLTSSQALNSSKSDAIVHDEIYQIEKYIRKASDNGYTKVQTDFTSLTDKNINSFVTITSVDNTSNVITLTNHQFETGDIVVFTQDDTLPLPLISDKEYKVNVIDGNTFTLQLPEFDNSEIIDLTDNGTGNHEVRKLIDSEKFYKAWMTFYTYNNPEYYLNIIHKIERHFQSIGYNIKKYDNPTTKTFYWVVNW